MIAAIWGVVKEGVVEPETPLPEGVRVQILLPDSSAVSPETKPIEANGSQEDILDARKALIHSLPGKYRLISSEDYMEAKRGEAALEDR
jgi:hypothetical protein